GPRAANGRGGGRVEVLGPAGARIARVIPPGLGGPSLRPPGGGPGGRIAFLGASSQRQLYAVDLRALDDARLYTPGADPVTLDGMRAGFPDARVFHAGAPLALPDRADGPPALLCEGFTDVALSAAGSELYATDFCDGTFTRVRLDLSDAPPVPFPPDPFPPPAQQR